MNNQNLFTIVLVAVLTVILAILGGVLAASGSPVAAALMIAPLALVGMCLMKEKVWYLWFLVPPLLVVTSFQEYGYLLTIILTLPLFIWNVMLRRTTVAWNKAPLLDIAVFVLSAYVAWLFIKHPFGLGISLMQDYYGGKGYILYLQGLIAYIAFSSLKTNSDTLGKVLYWSVIVALLFTSINTVKNLFAPEEAAMEMGEELTGERLRNSKFLTISVMVLQLLIIKYSVKDFFKRPWWIAVALGACYGVMISGFRSAIANVVFVFAIVTMVYKRWITVIALPVLSLGVLTVMSSVGVLRDMPYGLQRVCSVVPFLEVNPSIARNAQSSIDWRTEMWEWALDDRQNYIQDRVYGDGFARSTRLLMGLSYEKMYGLARDEQEEFASNGLWHNGMISTIQAMGYVGLALSCIVYLIGSIYALIVSRVYMYHKYRVPILFFTTSFLVKLCSFFFLSGGDNTTLAYQIVNLAIFKVLLCFAEKEGLYESIRVRKDYVPLVFRQNASKDEGDVYDQTGAPARMIKDSREQA